MSAWPRRGDSTRCTISGSNRPLSLLANHCGWKSTYCALVVYGKRLGKIIRRSLPPVSVGSSAARFRVRTACKCASTAARRGGVDAQAEGQIASATSKRVSFTWTSRLRPGGRSSRHPVAKVRDAGRVEHAPELEPDAGRAEQPPPLAEHDWDQVDLQLVEQPLAQQRLREVGAVNHTLLVAGG